MNNYWATLPEELKWLIIEELPNHDKIFICKHSAKVYGNKKINMLKTKYVYYVPLNLLFTALNYDPCVEENTTYQTHFNYGTYLSCGAFFRINLSTQSNKIYKFPAVSFISNVVDYSYQELEFYKNTIGMSLKNKLHHK